MKDNFIKLIITLWKLIIELPRYNVFQSLYYNFKWLPFNQAIKLPILMSDVCVHESDAKVLIESSEPIHHGMIKIGLDYQNLFWINRKSHLLLWKGGTLIFKGRCKMCKGTFLEVATNAKVQFGNKVGSGCGLVMRSMCKIQVKDQTHIGFETTIMDSSYHPMRDLINGELTKTYSPIEIGENSWIGANSIIKKGTHLPKETIVGQGSVVQGVFKESNTIIAGNPAVIVDKGYRIEDETFWDLTYILYQKR